MCNYLNGTIVYRVPNLGIFRILIVAISKFWVGTLAVTLQEKKIVNLPCERRKKNWLISHGYYISINLGSIFIACSHSFFIVAHAQQGYDQLWCQHVYQRKC